MNCQDDDEREKMEPNTSNLLDIHKIKSFDGYIIRILGCVARNEKSIVLTVHLAHS